MREGGVRQGGLAGRRQDRALRLVELDGWKVRCLGVEEVARLAVLLVLHVTKHEPELRQRGLVALELPSGRLLGAFPVVGEQLLELREGHRPPRRLQHVHQVQQALEAVHRAHGTEAGPLGEADLRRAGRLW